jgi:tetratricopeptide (TPR) repeat protein
MAKIKLKSQKHSEFNTSLKIHDIDYHIQTESGSEKFPYLTTTAYLNGTIVEVIKNPLDSFGQGISKESLTELMRSQHNDMVERLREKHEMKPAPNKKGRNEYIQDLKSLMARKNWSAALEVIGEAVVIYPDDAFMKSYYGYLKALGLKQYKEGITLCKNALEMLKKQMPVGGEFYYPVFFLNIGRVYNLSGKKDKAINCFRKGLEYDAGNKELFNELKRLGFRKSPPIPFLSRNNFINKYLGIALSKMHLR